MRFCYSSKARPSPLFQAQQLAELRSSAQHVFVSDQTVQEDPADCNSFNKVREVEGAGPEPWPGWMCDRGQPPVRITPPPRDGRAPRVNLYGASPQTGETIGERPVELEGGAAHGEHWETPHEAMPSARLPPMKSALPKSHRSNPDRCMAPPIARPGMTPGYPESSSYSRRSSVSTPANPVQHRISVLESRLRHLTDLLHTERIDHVRSNLDFNTQNDRVHHPIT